MHRSGTSALTRQIMDSGFELISEPLPPHAIDNPDGYWESRKTVRLNQAFLQDINSDWRDPEPLPHNFHKSKIARSYQREISRLIKHGLSRYPQIVLKDPRLCRLLPLWLPSLQKNFHHIAVILIVRNAQDVYQSLAKRALTQDLAGNAILDENQSNALWLRYNLEADLNSHSVTRKIIAYENLRTNPEQVNAEIHEFLQVGLPGASLKKPKSAIRPFIADSLQPMTNKIDTEDITHSVYESLVGTNNRSDVDLQ